MSAVESPELCLRTTYKQRCLFGLKDPDPSSKSACHKAARSVFSKYCSDECGIKYMQSRIDAWVKKGGTRERLWKGVKGAEKREGVVICLEDSLTKMEVDENNEAVSPIADVKLSKCKVEREKQRLKSQLDGVVLLREQIKKEMEVVAWRKRLLELASERAESLDQCGWDQRLCFGDEEYADFGAEALESYEENQHADSGDRGVHADAMGDGDGEWWCTGKKKCDRHLGCVIYHIFHYLSS
jgi:COMPASS component SPP1